MRWCCRAGCAGPFRPEVPEARAVAPRCSSSGRSSSSWRQTERETATPGRAPGASPLEGQVTDRRFGGAVTTWRVRIAGVDAPLEIVAPSEVEGPAPGDRVKVAPAPPGTGFLFPR
jgi:hypothetical protein